MPKVKVFMLGRFEIVANGTEVIKSLGSSKKRIVLLEYLILNRDKPILMKDLFEVLWPGENSTNPESALKTLVSRLRATLSDYSPYLSDCIITERGGYRWNPALDCEIDVFSFEAACNDVLRAASLTPEVRAQAATLMTLYAGELLPNSDMDAWVVARSVFLHNMYLKAVQHYIVLLKGEDAHDEIAQVCRLALDVDAFDATLNLELMTALLKIGRSSEALAQYNHATDLHYNQLGIQPPEGMLEFYKKLIKIDNASKTDIDSIRAELCADDTRSGAFVCEYVIFKDIYQLHMRNLSRLGTTMFIALITISSRRVRGPLALYCLTTIRVAAGAVAEAMAPSVMADAIEMTSGRAKCRATRAISTSTVVITACRMPTVTACLPIFSNALSRNSLPMTKAMKPSATCVMMP